MAAAVCRQVRRFVAAWLESKHPFPARQPTFVFLGSMKTTADDIDVLPGRLTDGHLEVEDVSAAPRLRLEKRYMWGRLSKGQFVVFTVLLVSMSLFLVSFAVSYLIILPIMVSASSFFFLLHYIPSFFLSLKFAIPSFADSPHCIRLHFQHELGNSNGA